MKKRKNFIITIIIVPIVVTILFNIARGKTTPEYVSGKNIIIENERSKEIIDVEKFIPYVLMAQMDESSPKELLKAQATVVRTYIYQKMGNSNSIGAVELGLPFCTKNQLKERWFEKYRLKEAGTAKGVFYNLTGIGSESVYENQMSRLWDIVSKTRGKVLKYKGKIVLPLFHQTSNGNTRDGNKNLGEDYSYLKSVKCESDISESGYLGIKYFSINEFLKKLEKYGIIVYENKKEKFNEKEQFNKKEHFNKKQQSNEKEQFNEKEQDIHQLLHIMDTTNKDKMGYLITIKIGDTKISGDMFRKALDLNSLCIDIDKYEKGLRITTKGQGHGFGMSLSYAKKMAENGKDWHEILKTFYECSIVDY